MRAGITDAMEFSNTIFPASRKMAKNVCWAIQDVLDRYCESTIKVFQAKISKSNISFIFN
jgi:hypothetical protein